MPVNDRDVFEFRGVTATTALLCLHYNQRLACAQSYLKQTGWADDEMVRAAFGGGKRAKALWKELAARDGVLSEVDCLLNAPVEVRSLQRVAVASDPVVNKWWSNTRDVDGMFLWITKLDSNAARWALSECARAVLPELTADTRKLSSSLGGLRRALCDGRTYVEWFGVEGFPTQAQQDYGRALLWIINSFQRTSFDHMQVLRLLASVVPIPPRKIRALYGYPPGTAVEGDALWNPLAVLFPNVVRRSVQIPELRALP